MKTSGRKNGKARLLSRVKQTIGLLESGPRLREPILIGVAGSFYGYTCEPTDGDEPTVVVASPYLAYSSRLVAERFRLTPTQSQVAGMLACRRTNAEIADAMGLSPNT